MILEREEAFEEYNLKKVVQDENEAKIKKLIQYCIF